jgi:hypothetical protein
MKEHPKLKGKRINSNYFSSELNKFAAETCRKDIVINDIDLIINNYKDNTLKIIESKHKNEKLSIGQNLLLKKLSKLGINTYVVYGDYPYKDNEYKVYSYQSDSYKTGTTKQLTNFLQK